MQSLTREAQDRVLVAVVGETPEIRNIYRIIRMAARATHPVLIVGEPGTGKEVIAKAIHSISANCFMPFRVRDCATLRAVDLERELVLCVEGNVGSENHESGTLFLDQILSLNLDLQGSLLRALQQTESANFGCYHRDHPRIIAASTHDLQVAVNDGIFRRDLYFRLNALSLRVPPLRERRMDIPLLATALMDDLSRVAGRRLRLSARALQAILTYDWPGNVRELENCLQRACCSASGPTVTLVDLPDEVCGATAGTETDFPTEGVITLNELERRSIEETLKTVGGDKQRAAKLLGIGKTTLYRKLKGYELGRRTQ